MMKPTVGTCWLKVRKYKSQKNIGLNGKNKIDSGERQRHVTRGQDTQCWVMLLWEIYLVIFRFFFVFCFVFFILIFFFLFLFCIVFHLRSCQECGQWDSQAARVTVHHHHHHYQHHHHHHYCHHHYSHPPYGIIIIILIIVIII